MQEIFENNLKNENSPYLLQHKNNPVNWYPWCDEALLKAQKENKPIFLSIGYSTCHWCHVMAHESFEDVETANLMNQYFINIKVDREERPDLDEIYLEAVMLISQHGGWPLSVFLTPSLKPFYGGTYFPLNSRNNMPSFKDVLKAISKYYIENSDDALSKANKISGYLNDSNKQTSLTKLEEILKDNTLNIDKVVAFTLPFYDRLLNNLENDFDHNNGGFGSAPKFPQPSKIEALLYSNNAHQNSFAIYTLNKIRCAGIIDQIGGGIARYSVDEKWLVPHFEKMLYDNAQILKLFCIAGMQLKKNNPYLSRQFYSVASDILEYLERDLKCNKSGLYYSAEDADSEGEEGAFYTFFSDEFSDIFKGNFELKQLAENYFKVTGAGNFEGKNILTIVNDFPKFCLEHKIDIQEAEEKIRKCKEAIFSYRNKKERPSLDYKCILSWNALLCTSLIKASVTSNNSIFLEKSLLLLTNIFKTFKTTEGFFHIYVQGQAKIVPFLDDLGFLLEACTEALTLTGSKFLLDEILEIVKLIHSYYVDPKDGILYYSKNENNLFIRPCKPEDNVIYSANSAIFGSITKLNLWISLNNITSVSLSQQKMLDALAFIALSNTALLAEKIPTACAQLLQKIKFLEEKNVLIIRNNGNIIPLSTISIAYDFLNTKIKQYFSILVEANTKYKLNDLYLYSLPDTTLSADFEYSFCNINGCNLPKKDISEIF